MTPLYGTRHEPPGGEGTRGPWPTQCSSRRQAPYAFSSSKSTESRPICSSPCSKDLYKRTYALRRRGLVSRRTRFFATPEPSPRRTEVHRGQLFVSIGGIHFQGRPDLGTALLPPKVAGGASVSYTFGKADMPRRSRCSAWFGVWGTAHRPPPAEPRRGVTDDSLAVAEAGRPEVDAASRRSRRLPVGRSSKRPTGPGRHVRGGVGRQHTPPCGADSRHICPAQWPGAEHGQPAGDGSTWPSCSVSSTGVGSTCAQRRRIGRTKSRQTSPLTTSGVTSSGRNLPPAATIGASAGWQYTAALSRPGQRPGYRCGRGGRG